MGNAKKFNSQGSSLVQIEYKDGEEAGRQTTTILSNAPLEKTTTYSGVDATVYIYRDLASISNSINESSRNTTSIYDSLNDMDIQGYSAGKQSQDIKRIADVKGFKVAGSERWSGGKKQDDNIELTYTDLRPVRTHESKAQSGSALSKLTGLESIIREVGSLQSITYSTFREKVACRTLGRVHAKAYTRGQRTIAGSMSFAVLQTHELLDFANSHTSNNGKIALLDQMDPFHVMIVFTNEYGSASVMHMFNVDINTEGMGITADDLQLSATLNFYAQDVLPIMPIGNAFNSTAEMLHASFAIQSVQNFAEKLKSSPTGDMKSLAQIDGEGSNAVQELLRRSRGLF